MDITGELHTVAPGGEHCTLKLSVSRPWWLDAAIHALSYWLWLKSYFVTLDEELEGNRISRWIARNMKVTVDEVAV